MKDFLNRLLLPVGVLFIAYGPAVDDSLSKFLFTFVGAILLNIYQDHTARKE